MSDPNRETVGKWTLAAQGQEDDLAEERRNMMWQLAVDAWAMKGQCIAEHEFQRPVERLERLRR